MRSTRVSDLWLTLTLVTAFLLPAAAEAQARQASGGSGRVVGPKAVPRSDPYSVPRPNPYAYGDDDRYDGADDSHNGEEEYGWGYGRQGGWRGDGAREWDKDRREAMREREKEFREWEKDRREAEREWAKAEREAWQEEIKARREWEKEREKAERENDREWRKAQKGSWKR